jgi:hypothetical protein
VKITNSEALDYADFSSLLLFPGLFFSEKRGAGTHKRGKDLLVAFGNPTLKVDCRIT